MPTLRVIGPGRAGSSLARALDRAGWLVEGLLGRTDDVGDAAHGVDLLVIATPDAAIAGLAERVEPVATTVVAHLAGSLGLDVLAFDVVTALGGHSIEVVDEHRAAYHAAAVIASNHLVALLAQAERVAATAGIPLEAYLDLVKATVDNVAALGPARALTGPAARGDSATLERHLEALDPSERPLYLLLAEECRKLGGAGVAL